MEIIFGNQIVDDGAETGDILQLLRRIGAEIRQSGIDCLFLLQLLAAHTIHAGEYIRHIDGLHRYPVFCHGDLVKAHGLKGGGAGADGTDVELLHAGNGAAGAGEQPQILRKGLAQRGNRDLGGQCIAELQLPQYVAHGDIAAQGVPTVSKVHLRRIVGIGLYQYRYIDVLECLRGAVFITEIRQTQDDPLILAPMAVQKIGIDLSLRQRLHSAVASEGLVHHQHIVSGAGDRLDHLGPGGGDGLAGEEPPIGKIQSERGFHRHKTHLSAAVRNVAVRRLSATLKYGSKQRFYVK